MIQKKVGKDYPVNNKPDIFSYSDVEYDKDGFVDAQRFLPADYDLVYLKLASKEMIPGWVKGGRWDGVRLTPQDKVLFWKRKPEE